MDPSLNPFFHPQGVAVIGASADPTKLGHLVGRNLIKCGYRGEIALVNPKGGELLGHPIIHTVEEIPASVDLAVLLLPAPLTPPSLEQVADHGIKAVIICSGGFREVDAAGAKLEEQCLEIAHRHGMRLIGPNCIGLLDFSLPLDTTFVTLPDPPKGNIALISQSGAVCGMIMDWAGSQGYGFSRMLSLGNMADISETDMLPGIVEDENTHVITFYIESIREGARFIAEARQAAGYKPMVAMKVGRSQAGQHAAASHTGALAGSDEAYLAAFQRAGILQAQSVQQLVEWASALAYYQLPAGDRIAVLTNAGGPGVIAADAVEENGLKLAALSQETMSHLAEILPSAASLHNPVDMLGGATRDTYVRSLQLLINDTSVDGIVVILFPPPLDPAENGAEALIPMIQSSPKPVVVALPGGETIRKAEALFRNASIPVYPFSELAVSAMGALVKRANYLHQPVEALVSWKDIDLPAARAVLEGSTVNTFLPAEEAVRLVTAYGIRTTASRLATSSKEAVAIATQIGYPVVLKISSPDILHKSDAGGVMVDLQDPNQVMAAFDEITRRVSIAKPEARVDGVIVQTMAGSGQEVILGARRDPQFGPLMMFGSGGVEVEGLKDVAFAMAPLTSSEAGELIQRTWAGKKLAGFRSIPAGDSQCVIEAAQRLSRLVVDCPEIDEIEINPLRVLPPGKGCIALDVRAKVSKVS